MFVLDDQWKELKIQVWAIGATCLFIQGQFNTNTQTSLNNTAFKVFVHFVLKRQRYFKPLKE